MPYPYGYFKPTGKEQGAMAIGSLLTGLLAAAQPRQPGEAPPWLKGIAGATAGYGNAYKNYQDMMGEAWQRDLYDKKYNQDVNQFDQTMGLKREELEMDRPYKESQIKVNEATAKKYGRDEYVDYNKIRDERTKRRIDIRKGQRDLKEAQYAPGEKERATFENINNLSGLPQEELVMLRKTPEYIAALNAFVKPNIMADPYSPDTGGSDKTPAKGLWESVKDRFSTPSQLNAISKGAGEALSNRSATQPSSIPDGTHGIDSSNNKKTIYRNGRWEYAD